MTKILYVITKSNWGGAQKYVYDLATDSKESGKEVTVAVNKEGKLTDRLSEAGVPFLTIDDLQRDISIIKEFKVLVTLIKMIKKVRPNILHVNSSKIGGLGSLAVAICGLTSFGKIHPRVVFTVHGWPFNEQWRGAFSKSLIKFFSYVTVILCNEVIVLSQTEYDQAAKWPFVKDKLKIEPLKIKDIDFYNKEKVIEKFSLNTEKFNIVTIAELHINKGLEYGVEAFAKIKESNPDILEKIHWTIIGDGEEKESIQSLVNKNGLDENIELYGFLEDAGKYLKGFDLFLLTSVKEGLPYVLLEAESAELPIIATDVGGIKERFEGHPNKVVPAKNLRKLSESIIENVKI
jgi:glycosyltransferase involved in cell wall biosynthesis